MWDTLKGSGNCCFYLWWTGNNNEIRLKKDTWVQYFLTLYMSGIHCTRRCPWRANGDKVCVFCILNSFEIIGWTMDLGDDGCSLVRPEQQKLVQSINQTTKLKLIYHNKTSVPKSGDQETTRCVIKCVFSTDSLLPSYFAISQNATHSGGSNTYFTCTCCMDRHPPWGCFWLLKCIRSLTDLVAHTHTRALTHPLTG